MLFSELKGKDVINIRDCRKLGRICDLDLDPCSGQICKVYVPGCFRFFCIFHCEPNVEIPFQDIKQVGPDIVLVDIRC